MAPFRGYLLLTVLLIAVCAMNVLAADTGATEDVKSKSGTESKPAVPLLRNNARRMRAAKPSPVAQQRPHLTSPQGTAAQRTTVGVSPTASPANKAPPQRHFEQQVLVVKGNPSEEKLNDEIRKAIRALLGPEQSEQVQIRELKNEEELRRIAPGARPIGVRLVQ